MIPERRSTADLLYIIESKISQKFKFRVFKNFDAGVEHAKKKISWNDVLKRLKQP